MITRLAWSYYEQFTCTKKDRMI